MKLIVWWHDHRRRKVSWNLYSIIVSIVKVVMDLSIPEVRSLSIFLDATEGTSRIKSGTYIIIGDERKRCVNWMRLRMERSMRRWYSMILILMWVSLYSKPKRKRPKKQPKRRERMRYCYLPPNAVRSGDSMICVFVQVYLLVMYSLKSYKWISMYLNLESCYWSKKYKQRYHSRSKIIEKRKFFEFPCLYLFLVLMSWTSIPDDADNPGAFSSRAWGSVFAAPT